MNREHPTDFLMLALVIVLALFTLAGCGGGDPDASGPAPHQPTRENAR